MYSVTAGKLPDIMQSVQLRTWSRLPAALRSPELTLRSLTWSISWRRTCSSTKLVLVPAVSYAIVRGRCDCKYPGLLTSLLTYWQPRGSGPRSSNSSYFVRLNRPNELPRLQSQCSELAIPNSPLVQLTGWQHEYVQTSAENVHDVTLMMYFVHSRRWTCMRK